MRSDQERDRLHLVGWLMLSRVGWGGCEHLDPYRTLTHLVVRLILDGTELLAARQPAVVIESVEASRYDFTYTDASLTSDDNAGA